MAASTRPGRARPGRGGRARPGALALRVDPLERRRDRPASSSLKLLTPTTIAVAALDRLLDPVRRLLDLALLEAALDRRERPAHGVDLVEVGLGGRLELVGQRSTKYQPASGSGVSVTPLS